MSIGTLFRPLLQLIAQSLVGLHRLVGGGDSGWSWVLAIVLLTVTIRALLFPLFVKQIKTQRAMAELQPKIKELQAKHKGDRETLNQELMKLYREHGANPLAGCLPLLLQMPVFICLYQVLRQLSPKLGSEGLVFPDGKFGVSAATARSLGRAKIFDAPIAAGFSSPKELLHALDATVGAVRTVAIVLIVSMAISTFVTSRQMMAKNTSADAQQQTQQRVLLYVMPLMLALFGFGVAIGTLVYWTTTNLFGMAQQAYVIRRLGPAPVPGAAAGTDSRPPASPRPSRAAKSEPAADGGGTSPDGAPGGTARPPARAGASRNAKRGKGQRRGGRR